MSDQPQPRALHKHFRVRVVSWARLVDNQNYGPGHAVFDIVIADGDGKVLFEARGFVMRRLDGDLQFEEVSGDHVVMSTGRKRRRSGPWPVGARLSCSCPW